MKVKVFIGSSKEALDKARAIQDLLFEAAGEVDTIKVMGWWHDECFPAGQGFMDALEHWIHQTNCAILVATEEDNVTQRGKETFQPRNNIILEYGMFSAVHGRDRTVLAVIGNPQLPSDLDGVMHLKLHTSAENSFKEINRGAVLKWFEQVSRNLQNTNPSLEEVLPRLNKAVIEVLKRQPDRDRVDQLASDLLETIASSFQSDFHFQTIAEDFLQKNLLKGSRSIFAIDVLGPQAWVTPSVYKYLAVQIRQYLRANATAEGFDLTVDQSLHKAIEKALSLAKKQGLQESLTQFDPDDPLRWSQGEPKLQYARILLWSKEELMNRVSDSVLFIHQAFHIPLFFVETENDNPARKHEFILFEKRNGRVEGFRSIRDGINAVPKLRPIVKENLGEGIGAMDYFRKLISGDNLLFAIDQRAIWSE